LPEYPKILSSYNINKWDLSLLLPKEGLENYKSLTDGIENGLDEKTLNNILEKAKEYGITTSLGDTKPQSTGHQIFECGAGLHFMSIQADLTAYPCPLLPYTRFKNLYGFSIHKLEEARDIWESNQFNKVSGKSHTL